MQTGETMDIYSIRRIGQSFKIIDQTLLPNSEKYVLIDDYQAMIKAIKSLQVRGAPAIGIAAVAGAFLACKKYLGEIHFEKKMLEALSEIEQSRPTAVNLFHATAQVRQVLKDDSTQWFKKLDELVDSYMQYEYDACEEMANNGMNFIPKEYTRFLTHCNTGSLATYGVGTALGVLKRISENREIEVFVDETRPLLQGSRLTMWELMKSNITSYLITDNMAARMIETKGIQAIIVGADRIAKNGDTANKIGTLNLAILAKHFQIPLYIVAPESTIDFDINSGKDMVIEERDAAEVYNIKDISIAPENVQVINSAFDITPSSLITAIITNKAVYSKPEFFS